MIIGIDGGLGSGKTAKMSGYLHCDFERGFRVLSNYGLNFKHEKLDVLSLLDKKVELRDVSIGIDEITVFMDCRTSISRMNRMLSYFILQSRKRNVVLYYTTQSFSMVDKRLIKYTDIQIRCEKLFNPNSGLELDDVRRFTVFDFRDPNNVRVHSFLEDISKFYGLYDTNEIIEPPF